MTFAVTHAVRSLRVAADLATDDAVLDLGDELLRDVLLLLQVHRYARVMMVGHGLLLGGDAARRLLGDRLPLMLHVPLVPRAASSYRRGP